MRTLNFTLVIAAVLLTAPFGSVSADIVAGVSLNAQAVVQSFNSLNNGKGYAFYSGGSIAGSGDIIEHLSATVNNPNNKKEHPNDDAYYRKSNQGGFYTIRLETAGDQTWTTCKWEGNLNYANGMSTSTNGQNLTIGAAYLYKMMATTSWLNRNVFLQDENPEFVIFEAAMRRVMDYDSVLSPLSYDKGQFTANKPRDLSPYQDLIDATMKWDNRYLQMLLEINDDKDFWTSAYNPDAYYEEIGNYSVFMMNSYRNNDINWYTDYLYIAKAATPYWSDGGTNPVAPEPATMLMFGTGLLTLPFVRRLRKK